MAIKNGAIVTVNVGSSSIKLAVFLADDFSSPLLDISVAAIGQTASSLTITRSQEEPYTEKLSIPDHLAALQAITKTLAQYTKEEILAIGYRLVHGGDIFTTPTLLSTIRESDWETLSQLDAEHTPFTHRIASHFMNRYPSIPHVACFDTAFFRDLPLAAKMLPLPKKYFHAGIRRYGFHGLSYTSVLEIFRQEAGEVAANGRVLIAHLGSGASITATLSGKPIDTTMSLTPSSGLIMSTRSGDIDPHIFSALHRQASLSSDAFDHMVSFEAGLLGVSGVTGDMHALLNLENTNEDAALAIHMFVLSVKKSIGALSTTLGGIDSLIFTGGIGEQSAALRARICKGLQYIGIDIDTTANEHHDFLISSRQSQAGVHVIATNEAQTIAKQTLSVLHNVKRGYDESRQTTR